MRKLNVDPKVFTTFSCPAAIYILGFLWADGYTCKAAQYSIATQIVTKDALNLENIFIKIMIA